jgi:hypothetical protein
MKEKYKHIEIDFGESVWMYISLDRKIFCEEDPQPALIESVVDVLQNVFLKNAL